MRSSCSRPWLLPAHRYDEAESLLERAVAIAPDFLLALLDLGQLRREQDRYAEALECFDRVHRS